MRLTIVLNGELKTCCSTYPPQIVEDVIWQWLAGMCEVETIDVKEVNWVPDELASQAIERLGEKAYPFIYLDGALVCAGYFPSRDELRVLLSEESKAEGLTPEEAGRL